MLFIDGGDKGTKVMTSDSERAAGDPTGTSSIVSDGGDVDGELSLLVARVRPRKVGAVHVMGTYSFVM
jgi:hypothetical protein